MSQSLFLFAGALGFQVVDNNLHMPQSSGAEVPNYLEPDFRLDGKEDQV